MTTDRPVFSVCSGVLAASLLLVLSPSAYADDMGGLWPVKDSAVVSAHEAGLDGSGVKVGMYDMQVVSDYPGLSDAKVKYQVGSFVDTDGEPAKCMLDDGDLQATVTSSDSGLYYSHGTAMLMWLVGNGKGWDGSQGRCHVCDCWPGYGSHVGGGLPKPCKATGRTGPYVYGRLGCSRHQHVQ